MGHCTINSCGNPLLTANMCSTHYGRKRLGKDIYAPIRGRGDRRFKEEDGCLLVPLGDDGSQGWAKVSKDFRYLEKYKFNKNNHGYARTTIDGKIWALHHLVIGKPDHGLFTDHINRDRLDNRPENLRHVTPQENSMNSNKKLGISGVRGISFNQRRQRWKCEIYLEHGKRKFIGWYKELHEATKAREDYINGRTA